MVFHHDIFLKVSASCIQIDTFPKDIHYQGFPSFSDFHQSLHIFLGDILVNSSWTPNVECLRPSLYIIMISSYLFTHFIPRSFQSEFLNCSQFPYDSYENILCWFHVVRLMLFCKLSEEEILSSFDHICHEGNSDLYYLQPYDMTFITTYVSIHTSSFLSIIQNSCSSFIWTK